MTRTILRGGILALALAASGAGPGAAWEPSRALWVAQRADSSTVPSTCPVGTSLLCDASGSEGHPTGWEWYVARPGAALVPTSEGETFVVTFDVSGEWTVGLRTRYAHLVGDVPYVSPLETVTVQVHEALATDFTIAVDPADATMLVLTGSVSGGAGEALTQAVWDCGDGMLHTLTCTDQPCLTLTHPYSTIEGKAVLLTVYTATEFASRSHVVPSFLFVDGFEGGSMEKWTF